MNGDKSGSINLPPTGTIMSDYMTNYSIVAINGLNLNAGNTLAFQYDSLSGDVPVNIDFIAYTLSDTENIPVVTLIPVN
jgi:hypothetical protein